MLREPHVENKYVIEGEALILNIPHVFEMWLCNVTVVINTHVVIFHL